MRYSFSKRRAKEKKDGEGSKEFFTPFILGGGLTQQNYQTLAGAGQVLSKTFNAKGSPPHSSTAVNTFSSPGRRFRCLTEKKKKNECSTNGLRGFSLRFFV